MSQRYYIAVPNNDKWGYQSIPTWKNYSFQGTLREAQERAIQLFIESEHLSSNLLNEILFYYDEKTFDDIHSKWDNLNSDEKYLYLKVFYDDYLKLEIDEFNKGLSLWDDISNDYKKNTFSDNLNVIELD